MTVGPNIAKDLQFQDNLPSGSWFNPSVAMPAFVGSVKDPDTAAESLSVYARLWSPSGQMIWHRQMTLQGYFGTDPIFVYQTVAYNVAHANEVRYLAFGPTITGGSYRIQFNWVFTEPIAWGATTAQIQAALERHPDIGIGNVGVGWNPTYRIISVEFANSRGKTNFQNFGVENNLTGSSTGITVSTPTPGGGDFSWSTGEYKWDMVAYDGSRYSGGGTNVRNAISSAPATFYLDYVPALTSTSPADGGTITSSEVNLTWVNNAGALGFIPITRVRSTLVDTTLPANPTVFTFDRQGTNLNGLGSIPVPPDILVNTHNYRWSLDIAKRSGAQTVTDIDFTLSYTRAVAHAAMYTVASDDAYIDVAWTASTLPDATFNGYVVKVRLAGVDETDYHNEVVWYSPTKSTNSVRIFKFPRNRSFIMSFYVRRNVGSAGAYVDNLPTSTTQTLNLLSVFLADPATQRYIFLDLHRGRRVAWQQSPSLIQPWSDPASPIRSKPVAMLPAARSRTAEFTAILFGTLAQRIAKTDILESMYFNDLDSPIVYADAQGKYFDVVLDGYPEDVPEGAWPYTEVSLMLSEIASLGVY